jgi:hypothetical protein
VANFQTHLIGASLVTGAAATMLAAASDVADETAVGCYTAGVVGGILPDIDLDTSTPLRIARRVVSTLATLLAVVRMAPRYSLVELAVLAVGVHTVIQVGFEVFQRFTTHRGLFHSLPAAAVTGAGTAAVTHHVFHLAAFEAWLHGLFITVGFVTHLVLDECYSVDVAGARLRRSFGSAVNLGEIRRPVPTLALYAALAGLVLIAPPADDALATLSDVDTYTELFARLLPDGELFADSALRDQPHVARR